MMRRDQDDSGTLLKKLLSPADAQSLVKPPPDHPPHSGPGVSTPLTGNLAGPPSQAKPSRQGLAGYFDAQSSAPADGGKGSTYVKVASNGQLGYLPRANLARALEIDPLLKIFET